jgi:hypothetical protein
MLTRLLCLFVIWPALLLTFRAPSPAGRPARALAPYRREWAAVVPTRRRVYGLRIQLVALPV